MSQRIRPTATLTVLTLGLLVGAARPGVAQERFTLSGDEVSIYNLVGGVTIEPGSGATVIVEVTRKGRDAGRLTVETGAIDGRETLRVRYPGTRIVAPVGGWDGRTRIRVRDDGTFFRHNDWRRGTEVTITSSNSGLEAYADLTIRVPAGKRVDVNLAVGEVRSARVSGDLDLNTASAPVRVTGHTGPLSVDVGSGSVDVTDVTGALSIDTGSGSVTAGNVRGDRISLDTGSGGVRGSNFTTTRLMVDTGSGGITLDGVSAQTVSLDTGSGSIDLRLTHSPQSIDVDTGSGGVTLRAPGTLGARVEMETGSGSIESDFPITVTRHSRDHVSGTIGDGKGRITIETGSGSIRLVRL